MPKAEVVARPAHRPKLFNEETIAKAEAYLTTGYNVIPTVAGLALELGVSRETVYQWAKENQEFSDTLSRLSTKSEQTLVEQSLQGKFNPTFAIFYSKARLGMKENDAPQAQQVNIQVITNGETPQISIG